MDKIQFKEELEFIYLLKQIHEVEHYSYNVYKNMTCLDKVYLAQHLFSKFQGFPAIISGPNSVNADPALALKNMGSHAILFAYDYGLNKLAQNSIFPHFGVGFDSSPVQELRMLAHSAFETPFIFNPLFNGDAVKNIHGHKLWVTIQHDAIMKWFMDELGIQNEAEDPLPKQRANFCLEVVERLGCEPIVDFEENSSSASKQSQIAQSLNPPSSPFYDVINWVHSEIQQCPTHLVHRDQIYQALEKWSKSLDSGLHIIYDILDYLTPLRDKHLIAQEQIPEDLPQTFTSLAQKLEPEFCYFPLIKNCIRVFEKLQTREMNKQSFIIESLEKEQQNLLYLQQKIALYDFLKQQVGIHLQNSKKAMQEIKANQEDEKQTPKNEELKPPLYVSPYEFSEQKYILTDHELDIHYEEIFDQENRKYPLCKKELYSDGSVKSEIYCQDELRHGPSSFYDPEGRLLAKGWFIKNQRMGINAQYYPNGPLYSLKRYKFGLIEGKQEYYYPNGALKTMMHFHGGKMEGQAVLYYPSGQMKRRLSFKEGKRHGPEEMWYPNGEKELEAEYENDHPIGTIKNWFSKGRLAKLITFHKSPNEFDMTLWNEEGQVVKSSASKPTDSIESLIRQTQELKLLLDEATLKLIEAFNKKKDFPYG
jgi:antitoxin component YwqK of YwqJK toxin-antitoxin module